MKNKKVKDHTKAKTRALVYLIISVKSRKDSILCLTESLTNRTDLRSMYNVMK